MSQPDRSARLDPLPFTPLHRRMLGISGVGWALDAMDVGLISFVMAALAAEWGLGGTELSWIGSVGFVGMAIGASLGGLLADRIGRRSVFAGTLLIYGVATGAAALSWSVASLLAFRFVIGLGLGAELPVASTLVSEFAPARIRGRIVVILEAFWALGWIMAALIGTFIIPLSDDGWRWALLIGAVPAIWSVVVRRTLPESVRFLEAQGRAGEAESIVRQFEDEARAMGYDGVPERAMDRAPSAGTTPPWTRGDEAAVAEHELGATSATRRRGTDSTAGRSGAGQDGTDNGVPRGDVDAIPGGGAVVPERAAASERKLGPSGLWIPAMRRRTLGLWLAWFGINFAYYGAFIWMPTLLVQRGYSMVQSFEFTLLITLAQIPGYAVAAYLIEKWGRRPTLTTFLAGSAVGALLFANATSIPAILSTGMLISFFNLGAWGALYAVTPEVYPTTLRGTGAGWAAGFGRIASIIAPLSVPPLMAIGGIGLVFVVLALFFGVAIVGSLLLPELRGTALAQTLGDPQMRS